MAHVVEPLDAPSPYRDSRSNISRAQHYEALAQTATLYVGNLSFYTTEEQIYELFSRCSRTSAGSGIKRIIMGLDRNTKTPCGFAFVEYYTHEEAVDCMRYISGTKLDERLIRCDLDPGYRDGRQYGRGKSGGQVRDEYREEYDAGRGGWGHNKLREEEERKRREEMIRNVYGAAHADGRPNEEGDETRIIPSGAEGVYEEMEGKERAGEGASASAGAGEKRRRDDANEDDEDARKNPRFREDDEDD
ncbi:RNA-binding domain-containing protein [Tilletiaria anomala UBC 951]|uniref:Nuclear cap-binding protein subunit 2 n=1 Tax=Tilletiaria anomala (strain ATCC 24038 / CBS 436.72 / UBC 951) TaxID=1037660 RepID=A0A066VKW0_TILAU|nr:RNA-binding domain-containing protein [Tilletiaria anomala UBC 951]KDN39384.1 RNA-binding domain-containing protein [Tilletiaria anomala UBC 951]